MKNYLLSTLLVAFTLQLFAQNSPSTVKRSPDNITYSDSFLTIPKRLGIPTASSDILDAIETPQNSAKLLYNTTLNKLRVYNPVSGEWRDAIEADLSNYFTKQEIVDIFNSIPQPDLSAYIRTGNNTNKNQVVLTNRNAQSQNRESSLTALVSGQIISSATEYKNSSSGLTRRITIKSDTTQNPQSDARFSDLNGINFTSEFRNADTITSSLIGAISIPKVELVSPGLPDSWYSGVADSIESFVKIPINYLGGKKMPNGDPYPPIADFGRDRYLVTSVNGNFADEFGNITLPQPDLSSYLRIDNPNTGNELRFNKNEYEAIFRTSTNTRLGLASFKSNRDFWNEETSELIEGRSLTMTAGEIFPGYYELSQFGVTSQAEGKFASGTIVLPSSGSMLYDPSQANYSQILSNVQLPYTSVNDLEGNPIKFTETPPFLALTVNDQYADEFGNIAINTVVPAGGNRLRETYPGMYTAANNASNPINLNLNDFDFFETTVGTGDSHPELYYNPVYTTGETSYTRTFKILFRNNQVGDAATPVIQGKTNKWKNDVKTLPLGETILEVIIFGDAAYIEAKSYVN